MDITNELGPLLDDENAYIVKIKDSLLLAGEALTEKQNTILGWVSVPKQSSI